MTIQWKTIAAARWKTAVVAAGLAVAVGAAMIAVDFRLRQHEVDSATQKFSLLGTLRKSALDAYLTTVRTEMKFWSDSQALREVSLALQRGWEQIPGDRAAALHALYVRDNPHPFGSRGRLEDARDGSNYSTAHKALHQLAAEFVTGRGYYDFFLIDPTGNIVYTVEKEADFATNLVTGPYAGTGLADVFQRVLADTGAGVHFSDFKRYAPSNDAPAIFIARRMVGQAGEFIGVMAMQLPTARIVEIMQFDAGMGESGETYLVGEDLLMRSDSRFSAESTILSSRVDTETVKLALEGKRGVAFTPDYRGISVLSAYDWLDIDGFRWAVMAEIDEAEIRAETAGLGTWLAAAGMLLYGLALWTLAVLSRLNFTAGSEGDAGLPDLDVGG